MLDSLSGFWLFIALSVVLVVGLAHFAARKRYDARNRRLRLEIKAIKREAAGALKQTESLMRAIQASPNGVVVLTQALGITWCNPAASKYLGLNPKRDVGQYIGHLVRSPSLNDYLTNQDWQKELVVDDLAFQLHQYESGALLLVRDIAAQSRSEVSRRDFVANVSHEIRTPLTVMLGYIQTVLELPLNEQERKQYLDQATSSGLRLQSLVDDLLTLSKLDEPLNKGMLDVDMQGLILRCEAEVRGLIVAQRRNLEISFDVQEPTTIQGVESEIYSAIVNLVTNAVRYTPDGGKVQVRWGNQTLTVTDTGVGIAPAHFSRVTERFYRVDKSRSTQTGGTGLGLAIVKHVASRHGARLEIESKIGIGSTFRLVFTGESAKNMP